MRLLGAVLTLIQGRCCLGVGLTLSFYSLPLMGKHLKGSGKCDFDKKTLLLQYRVPKNRLQEP